VPWKKNMTKRIIYGFDGVERGEVRTVKEEGRLSNNGQWREVVPGG
jgi:hypothetical protein